MKKFLAALLLIAEAAILSLSFTAEDVQTVDVIVEIEADDTDSAYEYAKHYSNLTTELIPSCTSDYIYDTLLTGFHARLPEASLPLLASLDFVTGVHISGTYEALSYSEGDMLMYTAEMIGASAASEAGLTGDGVIVAVLDSGFDVAHPAFSAEVTNTLDLSLYTDGKNALMPTALRAVDDASELYVNSKIPLAYDYADRDKDVFGETDHGTHVAGIIGAVPTEAGSMQGIAPSCQLLLMKVFSDNASIASDHVIASALEDAVKMGADIINLSLGTYAGPADTSDFAGVAPLLARAEEKGCIVVCAAGNNGISTDEGSLKKDTGYNYPSASYTDFGTVSSPSASAHVLSVASIDSPIIHAAHFKHKANKELYISFVDTNERGEVLDIPFMTHFDGKTLAYEVVPGIGEEADYKGINVKGKIALISRGTTTFVDKINIAAEHGAVGVIIYNNEPNEHINMELSGAKIPAISITLEAGNALIAEKDRRILFDDDFTYIEAPELDGTLSYFSSRGPTPSLTLKPDVSAVGSNVISTVRGGAYASLSGTSMAAPQLSGALALVSEKLRLEGVTDKSARASKAKTLLMNTATPALQSNGVEYSPRAQGAGLANLENMLTAGLSLTSTETSLAKIELYDKLDSTVSLGVTVTNPTDKPITAKLGVTLANDGYTEINGEYFNTLVSEADKTAKITVEGSGNLNRRADDYLPLDITLKAGEELPLQVTIAFDEAHHKELSAVFTNGYFAEGFVILESEGFTASLPYMGYVGDWGKAPAVDGSVYDEEYTNFRGTSMYVKLDDNYAPAGANIFNTPYSYDKAAIAFSPDGNGYADTIYFGASQLRNCKESKMTVTDEAGNIIYEKKGGYTSKTEGIEAAILFRFFWDGSDGVYARYKFPDGKYYITIEMTLDYREAVTQKYETAVILDTKDPHITSMALKDGKLTVSAEDETGILCISVYENDRDETQKPVITHETAVFDVSGITGDTLYCEVIDSAFNVSVTKISLSALSAEGAR